MSLWILAARRSWEQRLPPVSTPPSSSTGIPSWKMQVCARPCLSMWGNREISWPSCGVDLQERVPLPEARSVVGLWCYRWAGGLAVGHKGKGQGVLALGLLPKAKTTPFIRDVLLGCGHLHSQLAEDAHDSCAIGSRGAERHELTIGNGEGDLLAWQLDGLAGRRHVGHVKGRQV